MSAPLPRTIGPYEPLSLVGRGGMGVVYRARHRTLNCVRALKLLDEGDPQRVARFLREASALARVRHPNVVALHDVGQEGHLLYFAMDLVEGGRSLDVLMRDGLPLERGLALVEEVARGLQAVHEAGLVHRDVKPSNVVVDSSGHAFVIDFGLVSSSEAERLTRTGVLVGTPAYFAPEYVLGLAPDPDPRVDVYALGAILYEIATGTTPIEAETPQEFFAALASERPPVNPSVLRPELPRELDAICARALARRPENRYATARELADDVASLRAGKLPSHASAAARERARARAWSTGRRVGIALGVLLLLAGAGVGFAAYARAARVETALARARAGLEELERRMRKPAAHPDVDAVELERVAARVAATAREDAASFGRGNERSEFDAIARRAEIRGGELALWRDDIAKARKATEPDILRDFKSAEAEVEAGARIVALQGGIAALSSPVTAAACERAEDLLSRALDKDKERGDLYLWRAVERARRGDRAAARMDAQRAASLGFASRLENLVVLSLTGDPEEARKAILAASGSSDPSFARPFVARAASLITVRGGEDEARSAVEAALRFTPPGTPELTSVARAALERARPAQAVLANPASTLEEVGAQLALVDPLVAIARLAAPDERDPVLAKAAREASLFQSSRSNLGLGVRHQLAALATVLDPDSIEAWIQLASVDNGLHMRYAVPEALDALSRAKRLARATHERGKIAVEECIAFFTLEDWERMVTTGQSLLDELEQPESGVEEAVRNQLYLQVTRALARQHRPKDLVAFCDRAEHHGYVRPVTQYRAGALAELSRPGEALALFKTCLSPEYIGDMDLDHCSAMIDSLTRQLRRPLEEADEYLARAETFASGGDEHRKLRIRRAAIALDLGHRDDARRLLEAAITGTTPDHQAGLKEILSAVNAEAPDLPAISERLRQRVE